MLGTVYANSPLDRLGGQLTTVGGGASDGQALLNILGAAQYDGVSGAQLTALNNEANSAAAQLLSVESSTNTVNGNDATAFYQELTQLRHNLANDNANPTS